MTEDDECLIHFSLSVTWLNNAWRLMQRIRDQSGNELSGPAFRFALIEYCKPYKQSRGVTKRFKLDTKFIPSEFLSLHKRIVESRDQVHAHSDLSVLDARLSVHKFMGQRYAQIAQNYITGVEELSNLADIIQLIEGTLDNMYVELGVLEASLLSS
jgi:hypothetical protein